MLLFTEPVPRPALWGGTLLRDYFHYPQFPDDIGQSWSFSAQEGEGLSNRIVGMEGMTLLNLWEERPELFCSRHKRFPVIISLGRTRGRSQPPDPPQRPDIRPAGVSHGEKRSVVFSGNQVQRPDRIWPKCA